MGIQINQTLTRDTNSVKNKLVHTKSSQMIIYRSESLPRSNLLHDDPTIHQHSHQLSPQNGFPQPVLDHAKALSAC